MQEESGKKMWQFPWRYKESIAIVLGIVIVGFILQIITGNINFHLLSAPVNWIIGALIICCCIVFGIQKNNSFFRWFTSVPFSVTLIGALVVFGIIMGLTPQAAETNPNKSGIFSVLGFNRMTSSWPFVMIYLTTLLSLGALIVRKLKFFKIRDYGFYLNHVGLWVLLFSAGLGAADMRRYVMNVREGEYEWRVYNEHDEVMELPVAIELHDFFMEEYPPKLVVINRHSGEIQPKEKPSYFHIDSKNSSSVIEKWEITLLEYIHDAVRNSDSTYHEIHMPGASPAAKIQIKDIETGNISEGWVSGGNVSQLYMVHNLNEDYAVAMTQPEPKRFVSDISVYTQDGHKGHTLLEVNKPYKVGSWMLYQYDYDKSAGRLSTYSSIELVHDPWIVPVYIGIFLFALGSLSMLWIGNKRKEVSDDVE